MAKFKTCRRCGGYGKYGGYLSMVVDKEGDTYFTTCPDCEQGRNLRAKLDDKGKYIAEEVSRGG